MFAVDEATVAAVRRAFEERGELAAVVELRRRFRGIEDLAQARQTVRLIAGWHPLAERLLVNPSDARVRVAG